LDKLEFENIELSSATSQNIKENNLFVEYSSNVILALQDLRREHNKNFDNKASAKELKEVFRNGADCDLAKKINVPCGVIAFAKVNVFLRQKSGETITLYNENIDSQFSDISIALEFGEEDITNATNVCEKYNLNKDFNNIENLYLEDYTELEFDWE